MQSDAKILLIDDDPDFLEIFKKKLDGLGFSQIQIVDDAVEAAAMFESEHFFDIAFIDMTMPGMSGMELLEIIKRSSPGTECIMITAVNDARVAVECLNMGAYDYLVKPAPRESVAISLKRVLEKKRLLDILDIEKSGSPPALKNPRAFQSIVTRSSRMLKVLKEAELHAGSDIPVLITGESGSGKELLARAIHAASSRKNKPFTPVNMASLAPGLFEAEFFGHTKGAFTGADKSRGGYLERTHGGALFLDEIGDMALDLQGKLLRVLQEGEYFKLGTSSRSRADIRFIAATNKDIENMISRKEFRMDLYYRLRGGRLHLPPLRERREDIPLLVDMIFRDFEECGGMCGIDDDALGELVMYEFPGNIRELVSIIQSTVNLAQGKSISKSLIQDRIGHRKSAPEKTPVSTLEPAVTLAQAEKSHILKVYHRTGKNKSKTARLLDIGLNTLRRKLKSYGEA